MVIGSGMVGAGRVKYPYSYCDAFAAAVTIGLLEAKVKSGRGKPGPKQRDGRCEKMSTVGVVGDPPCKDRPTSSQQYPAW